MHQTAQFEEALTQREITIRQSLFLVVYMFTGLMCILAIVSALATSPRTQGAPPLSNSLQLSAAVSDTQEEIVK